MPDPLHILQVLAAVAALAAAIPLLCGWPWHSPRPARVSAGGVLGVGLAFFLGCWLLGFEPHWPPREDQDRLLLVLLPAVVAVELAAAIPALPLWLPWLLRLAIAAGAGRVLLHNTTYLSDLAGPGSREWSPAQTWLILGALAGALVEVWLALIALARRTTGRSVALALAMTCGGTAITIMLSGYTSGGQLALSLSAALAAATIASLVLSPPADMTGALGVGVVGLFGLLVIGRFFGQLTTTHAALLFFAPLLCWLVELPGVRWLNPRLGAVLQLLLVAVPLAIVLSQAKQTFDEAARMVPASQEPSLQDYMDYGK
jgi:hypothetical protein